MFQKFLFRSAAAVAAVMLLIGTAQAVDIETVPVGDPGNAGELSGNAQSWGPERICGAVDYVYNIGKYEVTAGQYTEFLNEVGGVDPYGLYNTRMWWNSYGCKIERYAGSGTAGDPYQYRVAADWAQRPVSMVTWYDAAMFANWLTSGDIHQGAYDTSPAAGWGDSNAGNYTGITPHNSPEMDALVAAYGKVWVIPTEDEWYKAAYYNAATSTYYDYPTSSDVTPGYVNNSGNLSGTGTPFAEGGTDPSNYATYDGDGIPYGIGGRYNSSEVGEWENSGSPYGTFDQGGNVFEWNEQLLVESPFFSYRGLRGGSLDGAAYHLLALNRATYGNPSLEGLSQVGIRVASIPEPGSVTLLVCALVAGLIWWRRRK